MDPEKLVEIATPHVLKAARTVHWRNPQLIDDAFQDAMVRLLEVADKIDDQQPSFEGYIYKTAKNAILCETRKPTRRKNIVRMVEFGAGGDDPIAELPDHRRPDVDHLVDDDAVDHLARSFKNIRDRQVLEMLVGGASMQDISYSFPWISRSRLYGIRQEIIDKCVQRSNKDAA